MSVVDLIIALIVVISVIVGFKRGFIKTLVGLVSLVLAFIIAYSFATPISGKLYDNYLEPVLSAKLGVPTEDIEGDAAVTDSDTSRLLFINGRYLYTAPKLASTIDISKLKNIEGMIANLDPKVVAKMDAVEMQRLVNFLCSSVCANKTISSCVSAYNKKYGTQIDVTPILKAAGVSSSTKIPAALSLLGMKIDVKNPILNVQKKNAEAATAAASKAAASKAALSSKTASSKTTTSKTSGATSSKSSSSKSTSSKTTTSRVSSATSSVTTTAVTSPDDIITDAVEGYTEDIIAAARQGARTIAVKLVSCLVFVLLFILVRLILMLFAKLLSGIIDKIPVVSGMNKLLGGILGIAGGLVVSAVLVIGFVSVSPLITDDSYVQAVDNSLICRTATKMIYGADGNEEDVTVGDSGTEDEYSFNEDDFDFSEDEFDFTEENTTSEAG